MTPPPRPAASKPQQPAGGVAGRRAALALLGAPALMLAAAAAAPRPARAAVETVETVSEAPGLPSATRGAARGDLVLIHYVGTLKASGTVFDSTRPTPDLFYRDGGPGELRPLAFALGGQPTPGVCAGLAAAIEGMKARRPWGWEEAVFLACSCPSPPQPSTP